MPSDRSATWSPCRLPQLRCRMLSAPQSDHLHCRSNHLCCHRRHPPQPRTHSPVFPNRHQARTKSSWSVTKPLRSPPLVQRLRLNRPHTQPTTMRLTHKQKSPVLFSLRPLIRYTIHDRIGATIEQYGSRTSICHRSHGYFAFEFTLLIGSSFADPTEELCWTLSGQDFGTTPEGL